MKTIVMICRSKDEEPEFFVQLVKTIFPECEVQSVYSQFPLSTPKILRMGGAVSAICASTKKTGSLARTRPVQLEKREEPGDAYGRPFARSRAGR